jgi:hypothetical protein
MPYDRSILEHGPPCRELECQRQQGSSISKETIIPAPSEHVDLEFLRGSEGFRIRCCCTRAATFSPHLEFTDEAKEALERELRSDKYPRVGLDHHRFICGTLRHVADNDLSRFTLLRQKWNVDRLLDLSLTMTCHYLLYFKDARYRAF